MESTFKKDCVTRFGGVMVKPFVSSNLGMPPAILFRTGLRRDGMGCRHTDCE